VGGPQLSCEQWKNWTHKCGLITQKFDSERGIEEKAQVCRPEQLLKDVASSQEDKRVLGTRWPNRGGWNLQNVCRSNKKHSAE